jgi:lysozyme family protein
MSSQFIDNPGANAEFADRIVSGISRKKIEREVEWDQRLSAILNPAIARLPLILSGLLSAALLLHVTLQRPSLLIVFLLSLAIIAAAAWSHWRDAKRERVPLGTIWARSRLAWGSIALLIPLATGLALHRQSHDGPTRLLAHLDAPVSAVAAGRGAGGEHLVAVATYGGELHIGNPDNPAGLRSVPISEGAERPIIRLLVQGDQALGIAPAVIGVREGEVLSWTGEGEPVTIWSGAGAPLVALDEGQRLAIVETRPLLREDGRYAALSRVWDQSTENNGVSFGMAMSLTGRLANFTLAISLADPLSGATEAVHFQQAPILPTALAASGKGANAHLVIGGSEGELVACTQGDDGGVLAELAGAPYFACTAAVPSGSASSIATITLEGDTATTQHRDGTVVAWTRAGNTWTPGELGQSAPAMSSAPGRMRLPGSDVELAAFRDHAPETAMLPDGRIIAGGWDGRVMIVDPEAAGAMARGDPAAWIASLWAPVGDTARTMFANMPGLGSSNPWERLSSADRAIAIDRNPRGATDVWFAVGNVIARPRESIIDPVLDPDAKDGPGSRSRLDAERAVSARDRTSSVLEDLGLSGIVTPNASGTVTTTIGTNPTRQQVQGLSSEERAWRYAVQTNTVRAYRDYLAKYPNGDWAADANAAIAKLLASTNDSPAQSNDYPVQSSDPPPQTNAPPQQAIAAPQQTTASPEQATPPPPQAADPVIRRRTLGSADISAAFAVEAEAECPAGVAAARIRNDPVLATACVVADLRATGEYEYVEFDYIARPAQAAAGFGVSAVMRDQWALGAGEGGANLSALGWPASVAADAAAPGVVVAIIDTGIASERVISANAALFAPGYDMVSDPLMGNDGDGRDSDPNDSGFRCNTDDPRETASLHGTHVAGLVAAAGAPGLKIVPVRALGRCGGKLSDINDAILWAAGVTPARDVQGAEVWNANPANIINLSFEFPVACPASLQDAIDQAVAVGAIVVAAAGNGGRDAAMWSPGGCNSVVSVGASDARGAPAAYSNFGAGILLYAPGGDLARDDNGDGVKDGVVSWGEGGARCVDAITGEARRECRHVMSAGTSSAAALTTAALAVLKAENPAATNGDLLLQLRDSTRASCVPHPNPRHRRPCVGPTGGPVRVLGVEVERDAAAPNATSDAALPPAASIADPDAAFARAMAFVERWEGGLVDSPNDPVGRTFMGVSQTQWDTFRDAQGLPTGDVSLITAEDAATFYRASYWSTAEPFASERLQLFMFDTAVHMGPQASVRLLQQALGLPADGALGPVTISAANTFNESDLLEQLVAARWSRYEQMAEQNPNQAVFLPGWSRRMQDLASEIGVLWARPDSTPQPARIPSSN